ncbi:MAG: hypothetical protein VX278_02995, partial [Myxococcota bacterium]|nr:hypothetical protein [Myxococcota bacterium]
MIWALIVGCFAEFPTRDFPPSLLIEQPPEEYRSTDGAVYNENTAIPFVLQIIDNDSNAQDLYVRVQSDINDMLFEGMPDSDGMVSIIDSSLEPGTHQITINVADEENLISSEFPLVINGLPSIPELEILPQNPTTEDHLTADVILIEDPEGDEVTLDFVWSLNGVEQEVTESALN